MSCSSVKFFDNLSVSAMKAGAEKKSPSPDNLLEKMVCMTNDLQKRYGKVGVIFDMDGTIYKSEVLQFILYQVFLGLIGQTFSIEENQMRMDSPDYNDFRELLTKKLKAAGVSMTANQLISNVDEVIFALFESHKQRMLRPYILRTLQYLKAKSVQIGVVTLSSRVSATKKLETCDILKYFDHLICGEDVKNKKPDPEGFFKVADAMKLKPEEIIVIEDSKNGLLAAVRGNFNPLCYKDVSAVPKFLRKENVNDSDRIFDRLIDITDFVSQYINDYRSSINENELLTQLF